jgi:hypothetical protein
MNEYVTALILFNEAESLLFIEPFYFPFRHRFSLPFSIFFRWTGTLKQKTAKT